MKFATTILFVSLYGHLAIGCSSESVVGIDKTVSIYNARKADLDGFVRETDGQIERSVDFRYGDPASLDTELKSRYADFIDRVPDIKNVNIFPNPHVDDRLDFNFYVSQPAPFLIPVSRLESIYYSADGELTLISEQFEEILALYPTLNNTSDLREKLLVILDDCHPTTVGPVLDDRRSRSGAYNVYCRIEGNWFAYEGEVS